MRALVVSVVLAVTGVLVAVPPAYACSCAQATIEDVVAREPDAAAGLVRRVDDGSVQQTGTLAVLAELHGELPDAVTVQLDDGASCRPMVAPGQIAALTFRPEGGGWAAIDCGMLDLGSSLALIGGDLAPDPDATGPPALVVAGSFPGATLAALDAELRVLGTAEVPEWLDRVVACGDEVVTIRTEDAAVIAERRSLPDLAVTSSVRLDAPEGWQILALRCDDDGRVQSVTADASGNATRITPDLLGDPTTTLTAPAAGGATFVGDEVWLMAGDNDGRTSRIDTVDLGTGAVATRRSFDGLAGYDLSASPDGRFVTVRGFAEEPVLLVLETASATPVGESTGWWMPVAGGWVGPDRLVLQDESGEHGGNLRLRIVEAAGLRVVEEVSSPAGWPLVLAGDALVFGGGTELTVRRPDGGLHASPDLRLIGANQAVALGDIRGPEEEVAAPSPEAAAPEQRAAPTPAWQLVAATLATVAVIAALVVLRRRRRAEAGRD